VVELLSNDASINILSQDGNTPLHTAAYNNRKSIVELLLRTGSCPLFFFFFFTFLFVCLFFYLNIYAKNIKGADPSIPNQTGLIPYEVNENKNIYIYIYIDLTYL
jgi:hypothetical protein